MPMNGVQKRRHSANWLPYFVQLIAVQVQYVMIGMQRNGRKLATVRDWITEGDFQIKRIKQKVEFLACTDDEFDYEAVEQKRSHKDDFLSDIVAADATVEEQRRQSEAKRPRGVNFTSLEEDMLVELVIGKKEVLENKNSDTDSCKTKAKAWEELAIEFNIRCPSNVVCNRGYIKPFANLYL